MQALNLLTPQHRLSGEECVPSQTGLAAAAARAPSAAAAEPVLVLMTQRLAAATGTAAALRRACHVKAGRAVFAMDSRRDRTRRSAAARGGESRRVGRKSPESAKGAAHRPLAELSG